MSSNLRKFLINKMNPELLPLGGTMRRKYTVAAHERRKKRRIIGSLPHRSSVQIQYCCLMYLSALQQIYEGVKILKTSKNPGGCS